RMVSRARRKTAITNYEYKQHEQKSRLLESRETALGTTMPNDASQSSANPLCSSVLSSVFPCCQPSMSQPNSPHSDPHQGQPIVNRGRPLQEARAAMVLLHGRGASAQSILQLAD